MFPPIFIGPQKAVPAIGVHHSEKWVRIIFVDVRKGATFKQVEYVGKMVIPTEVYRGKLITNWKFDELTKPLKGAVTDLQAQGCSIVFPIAEDADAVSATEHRTLSIKEITQIFEKYHPTFKKMRKK